MDLMYRASKAGASASDPLLVGEPAGRTSLSSAGGHGHGFGYGYNTGTGTGVGEDGTLLSAESAANASRTIRLVGTGASGASQQSVASGSSAGTGTSGTMYTHSYTGGAGSALSMSSYTQTDLMLSRYPSSTKMAGAAAAGVSGGVGAGSKEDPEELEARARVCAEKCWKEDESFLIPEKLAEWLGGTYVDLYFSILFVAVY